MEGRGLNPPPTNFHDPESYRHGRDSESLRRVIRLGILEESSRMPAFEHIAPDELDALVGYLTSLQTTEK